VQAQGADVHHALDALAAHGFGGGAGEADIGVVGAGGVAVARLQPEQRIGALERAALITVLRLRN
jgi:hypothetical protein